MIALTILFAVFVLASLWERHDILARAREERLALENRLVALTDRDASVLIHSQEHVELGNVSYVDERAELELQEEVD